jgi:hypothetical protein
MSTFQYQAFAEPVLTSAGVDVTMAWYAEPVHYSRAKRHSIANLDQFSAPSIAAITTPNRVARKFSFAHDETIESKSSRLHEQQVAKYLNQLLLSGELLGTPQDPALGYQCDDIHAWNTVAPATLKEALDRIAAALKTIMGGIP